MKHLIVALLCLMLWGCARQIPPAVQETAPETTSASAENSLYAPGHPLENEYPGLIRAYPLTLRKVHGLRAFGKDLLALSRRDKTTLTVFSGEELRETACLTLDFHLQQRDPSLQIHGNHISFFDPQASFPLSPFSSFSSSLSLSSFSPSFPFFLSLRSWEKRERNIKP